MNPRRMTDLASSNSQQNSMILRQVLVVLCKDIQSQQLIQKLKFDKKRIVIGSVVSADLRLSHPDIAPIHAVVELSQDQEGTASLTVFDLASDTGVWIQQKLVVVASFKLLDPIQIGPYLLSFHFELVDCALDASEIHQAGYQLLFWDPKENKQALNLLESSLDSKLDWFDYLPQNHLSLEGVMCWRGRILSVKYFDFSQSVCLSTLGYHDFLVPEMSWGSEFKLMTSEEGKQWIHLTTPMKGVLQSQGHLWKIEDLIDQNKKKISFSKTDFAKIIIQDLVFYLSFTPTPPQLRRRLQWKRDYFFWKIMFICPVLVFLFVWGMQKVFNIDPSSIPLKKERSVTVLYQKLSIPQVPNRSQENRAQPNQVQKEELSLKHDLGKKLWIPQKTIQSLKIHQKVPRKDSKKRVPERPRHRQAPTWNTFLDSDVSLSTENSHQDQLWSEAQRKQKKTKPNDVPTGKAVLQSKSLQLEPVLLPVPQGNVVVRGRIQYDAILSVIELNLHRFKHCYEQHVAIDYPASDAKVLTRFWISPFGRVTQAEIKESSFKNRQFNDCIIKLLKILEFPIPDDSQSVEVLFPFRFSKK